MPGWVYVLLAILGCILVGTVWIQIRTRRIAAARPGESFDTFSSAFGPEEVPEDVLQAVYMTFQKWCSGAVAAFPVRAADNIGRIYGMVDDDLEDAVLQVLKVCSRQLSTEANASKRRPVVSVRDFVMFVAACPKSS